MVTMVSITIPMTEEEHKILKENAKSSRQSISQYILSKVIDEERKKEEDKLKGINTINEWIEKNKHILERLEQQNNNSQNNKAPRGI